MKHGAVRALARAMHGRVNGREGDQGTDTIAVSGGAGRGQRHPRRGLVAHPAPALIYNPSPSVPRGFYVRAHEPVAVGDFVTLRAADASPAYAQARDFTDRTDRFIKRVAAVGGTLVCAEGDRVTVPGRAPMARLAQDSAGRVLPSWDGCRTLGADEVFLLGDTADSFDSRYWGPVHMTAINGVWRPLF